MISASIKPATGRKRWQTLFGRRPKILALFSYRFDAHLVPDLIANIDPIVDGWIAFDDRAATGLFSSEVARRRALLEAAKENGADWILGVDPDERFEVGASEGIRPLVRVAGRVAWGFDFREMYTPDSYRVDGIWGRKKRFCLFSMFDPAERYDTGVHDLWYPRNAGFREKFCGLNLYHLKMIDPARRTARARLYKTLDPENRLQPIGYDYLADEAGAKFETIAPNRHYHPPHVDDGGLWMLDQSSAKAEPEQEIGPPS